MLKGIVKQLFRFYPFRKLVIIGSLKLHNLSYRVAGRVGRLAEPDLLHPKHRLMRYHDWFVTQLQENWRVLDVGCGNGALTYDLGKRCASVVGIDIDEKSIEWARSRFARDGITYVCEDATEYKFGEPFDAIVMSNVLEHIEDRVEFLKAFFSNQNRGDSPVLLLRVPMITRDWITLYKKEKGVEWRLDLTHHTEYTLDQLYNELGQAGLDIESYEIKFGEFYGVIRKK